MYSSKIIKIFFYLFLIQFNLINGADSVKLASLFSNISGNARIDSLNNHVFRLNRANLKLRKEIAYYTLELSQKNNYSFGIAQSLNNIALNFDISGEKDSALLYYKKSLKYIDENNSKLYLETVSKIANEYSKRYILDSSIVYFREAMKYAKAREDSLAMGNLLNSIEINYWRKGELNKAIKMLKLGLEYRKAIKNKKLIAKSLNNIGTAYFKMANYRTALEYYIESLKIRREYEEFDSSIIMNNIGLIYLKLRDMKLAESYFKKALINAKKTNSILGEGYAYLSFGDLYFQKKKFITSLEYYKKSKRFYEKLNDINGIVQIENKIGLVYLKQNKVKLAKRKFLNAYKKSKKHGIKLTQTRSLINYTKVDIQNGRYIRAKMNLNKALNYSSNWGFPECKLEIYMLLSKVYEKLDSTSTALQYFKKYNTLKDSLFNERKLRVIAETKERFEAIEQEKRNEELKITNQIQTLKLENYTTKFNFAIVFLIFAFFLILYLFYSYNLRTKQNQKLIKVKQDLEEANKLLKQYNETKDKFFAIISHDLKNPFNTLLGASQMLSFDDGSMTEEERKELIEIIASDTQRLYLLLDNLLSWANSQNERISVEKTKINLYDAIYEVVLLYKSSAKRKNIDIQIDIPKDFVVLFDEFMFRTVIRNLVSNGIKFSHQNGKIKFEAFKRKTKIHLKISDTGIGIDRKMLAKLLDDNFRSSRLGTDKEKGTGLGLMLSKDFIKENNAKINVTSEVGKGTTFEIILDTPE